MMLPQTDTEPPKQGAMMRAPSISTVMMQNPLTNATEATEATTGRGNGEDAAAFTINFLPTNQGADKAPDKAGQWNDKANSQVRTRDSLKIRNKVKTGLHLPLTLVGQP